MNATATAKPPVEERVARKFPVDIADHVATVVLNSGAFRHMRCKKPGPQSYHHAFTITTWPGFLAISGDMGSYVFSRIPDMFEFFRRDDGEINEGYWAEKLFATDKSQGHRQYSPDRFREVIEERLSEWLEHHATAPADRVRKQVDALVLQCADHREHEAREAADSYKWNGKQVFPDFWEHNLQEYTYQYLWCCHAIVWAIKQWDALVAATPAPAEVPA